MRGGAMGEYDFAPGVDLDLEAIYEFGEQRFGRAQAERYQAELFGCFQLLADFPGIAGQPFKVKHRELFRFPFGSHVVVFTLTSSGIRIVAVFRGSMDWRRQLNRRGS